MSVYGRKTNANHWWLGTQHAFNTCESCTPDTPGDATHPPWTDTCDIHSGHEDDCDLRPWTAAIPFNDGWGVDYPEDVWTNRILRVCGTTEATDDLDCWNKNYGLYPRKNIYSEPVLWYDDWTDWDDDDVRKYRFKRSILTNECSITGVKNEEKNNHFIFGVPRNDSPSSGLKYYPYPDSHPGAPPDDHSPKVVINGTYSDNINRQTRFGGELGEFCIDRPSDARRLAETGMQTTECDHGTEKQFLAEPTPLGGADAIRVGRGDSVHPDTNTFECGYALSDFDLTPSKLCSGEKIQLGKTCNSANGRTTETDDDHCHLAYGKDTNPQRENNIYQCVHTGASCDFWDSSNKETNQDNNVCLIGKTSDNRCFAKPKSQGCIGKESSNDNHCKQLSDCDGDRVCEYIPENYNLNDYDPSNLCRFNNGKCEKIEGNEDQNKYNCLTIEEIGMGTFTPHDNSHIKEVVQRIIDWRTKFWPDDPDSGVTNRYLNSCNYAKIMGNFCKNKDYTNDGKVRSFYSSDNDNLKYQDPEDHTNRINICKEWKDHIQEGNVSGRNVPDDLEWCNSAIPGHQTKLSDYRKYLSDYQGKDYNFYNYLEYSVNDYCNDIKETLDHDTTISQEDLDPICHCILAEKTTEYIEERERLPGGIDVIDKRCYWPACSDTSMIDGGGAGFVTAADLKAQWPRSQICPENVCIQGIFLNNISATSGGVNVEINAEMNSNCPGGNCQDINRDFKCQWKSKNALTPEPGTNQEEKWYDDLVSSGGGHNQKCKPYNDSTEPCGSVEAIGDGSEATYDCKKVPIPHAEKQAMNDRCPQGHGQTPGTGGTRGLTGAAAVALAAVDNDGGVNTQGYWVIGIIGFFVALALAAATTLALSRLIRWLIRWLRGRKVSEK